MYSNLPVTSIFICIRMVMYELSIFIIINNEYVDYKIVLNVLLFTIGYFIIFALNSLQLTVINLNELICTHRCHHQYYIICRRPGLNNPRLMCFFQYLS